MTHVSLRASLNPTKSLTVVARLSGRARSRRELSIIHLSRMSECGASDKSIRPRHDGTQSSRVFTTQASRQHETPDSHSPPQFQNSSQHSINGRPDLHSYFQDASHSNAPTPAFTTPADEPPIAASHSGPEAEGKRPSRFQLTNQHILTFSAAITIYLLWDLIFPPGPETKASVPYTLTRLLQLEKLASRLPIIRALEADPSWEPQPCQITLPYADTTSNEQLLFNPAGLGTTRGVKGYQRVFVNHATGEVRIVLFLGADTTGWPFVVHGGLTATLLTWAGEHVSWFAAQMAELETVEMAREQLAHGDGGGGGDGGDHDGHAESGLTALYDPYQIGLETEFKQLIRPERFYVIHGQLHPANEPVWVEQTVDDAEADTDADTATAHAVVFGAVPSKQVLAERQTTDEQTGATGSENGDGGSHVVLSTLAYIVRAEDATLESQIGTPEVLASATAWFLMLPVPPEQWAGDLAPDP